jgi:hypothetical protein
MSNGLIVEYVVWQYYYLFSNIEPQQWCLNGGFWQVSFTVYTKSIVYITLIGLNKHDSINIYEWHIGVIYPAALPNIYSMSK